MVRSRQKSRLLLHQRLLSQVGILSVPSWGSMSASRPGKGQPRIIPTTLPTQNRHTPSVECLQSRWPSWVHWTQRGEKQFNHMLRWRVALIIK
jgi:hypothetical protein